MKENDSMINLSINKDLVAPIIELKVKDAIMQSLGGSEEIVKKIIDQVFKQRVDQSGKISSYSSDNKYDWFDIVITNKVKEIVQAQMLIILADQTVQIKEALENQIKTKKGASMIASALMSCLDGNFKHNFKLEFTAKAQETSRY